MSRLAFYDLGEFLHLSKTHCLLGENNFYPASFIGVFIRSDEMIDVKIL